MKILVTDPLGPSGMAILTREKTMKVEEQVGLPPEELKKIIGNYDAIIIRSGTKLTKDILEKAGKLRVVGRAGVGVDNVDMETATKKGIIVMNTPEGNTISTAEHTCSMMMALARNIPQACASVKGGEWKRQQFLGEELNGKTLGVIGFGRIGREVTRRAQAFGMRVVVHDPFISEDAAKDYGVEFADLRVLLKRADYITVHTPLTPETKHIINSKNIKFCKKGVKILNCARGGIIEEAALINAIKSGNVAGVALDVFENEPPKDNPLLALPQVIATPHLGAATQEAQENVAIEVAKQVIDALKDRAIKNAVNLPNLDPESFKVMRPWISLAEKIGLLYMQLFGGTLKQITIRYGGDVSKFPLAPLTLALIKGTLSPICGSTVNFVNAGAMAKERGITVNESTTTAIKDFTNFIELEVPKNQKSIRIVGTLFENRLPRIVRIDEFLIDVEPVGTVIFIKNEDQPGVVGTLGTILGKNNINIAEMSLGRVKKQSRMLALTVINTDNDVPADVLEQIKKFKPIIDAKVVKL